MKVFVALALVAFVAIAEARSIVARDVKSDLIARGNALLKKADDAIAHLRAGTHTLEVAIVKHQEETIKKLITDLTAATDDAKVTSLEHELSRAEHRLEAELTAIQHRVPTLPHLPRDPIRVPVKRDAKSDLIARANALLTRADAAIAHLRTGTHLHEVAIVKSQEEAIKKLIVDLTAATDDAKITQLEHELTRADHRLEHELTLIQGRVPTLPHIPRTPVNPIPL